MVRWILLLGLGMAAPVWGGEVAVSDPAGLLAAIGSAQPGDRITLLPGDYAITATRIAVNRPGAAGSPIVVRAGALGEARIALDSAGSFVEGFLVSAPFWQFENLDIEGLCSQHSQCEHAFHIVGNADFTVLRNNRMHGFNAMIKANISSPGSAQFPDDVLVEGNEMFNPTPRQTANPVTPIDVVGGRRWIIRGNTIYDHAKAGGNFISYAAFLKGNAKDGIIERNLVWCERFHSGQVRLGLSLGGGGTSPNDICEDNSCSPESEGAIVRNNIVVNCPADVGLYLNEAAAAQVHNNTLYNTTGIDVRFDTSVVDLRNNLLNGQIRNRDGGTSTEGSNLENVSLEQMRGWFEDPDNALFTLLDGTSVVNGGEPVAAVSDDFCARPRLDGQPDLGAVEYTDAGVCDTTVGGGVRRIFSDGFEN